MAQDRYEFEFGVKDLASQQIDKVSRAISDVSGKAEISAKSFDAAGQSLFSFGNIAKGAFAAFASFSIAGKIAQIPSQIRAISDEFTTMQNMIKNVVGAGDLEKITDQMFDLANEARVGVREYTTLFTRIDYAIKQTGGSAAEAEAITSTLSKAIAVAGRTGEEASSAMLQISQAFNKGKLDGDEFRTVMETMPDVMQAIADKLGVAKGELIDLAPQGVITADIMKSAILDMKGSIDKGFAQSIPTISQSFTVLRNNVVEMIGNFNQVSGASSFFANAILGLSNALSGIPSLLLNIENIAIAISPIIAVLGARIAYLQISSAVSGSIMSLSGGLTGLAGVSAIANTSLVLTKNAIISVGAATEAFLVSNPFGWVALAVGAMALAFTSAYASIKSDTEKHNEEMRRLFDEHTSVVEKNLDRMLISFKGNYGLALKEIQKFGNYSEEEFKNIELKLYDEAVKAGDIGKAFGIALGMGFTAEAVVNDLEMRGIMVTSQMLDGIEGAGNERSYLIGYNFAKKLTSGFSLGIKPIENFLDNSSRSFGEAYSKVSEYITPFISKINELNESAKKQQVSISSLKEKLKGLQGEYETVSIGSKRFNELTEEIKSTQEQLNEANGSTHKVASSIGSSLSPKIKEAKEKTFDFSKEINKLQKDYSDLEQHGGESLAKLEKEHSESVRKMIESAKDLQDQITALQNSYNIDIQGFDTSLGEEVVKQQEKIAAMEKDISDKKKEFFAQDSETQKSKITGYQEEMAALVEKLNAEKTALEEFTSTHTGLDDEIEAAKKRNALTDFERFVSDMDAKREERTADFESEKAILEEKVLALEKNQKEEAAIYEQKRNEFLKTDASMQKFKVRFLGHLDAMSEGTKERINGILVLMQRLRSTIDGVNEEFSNPESSVSKAVYRFGSGTIAKATGSNTSNSSQSIVINAPITLNGQSLDQATLQDAQKSLTDTISRAAQSARFGF